MANDALKLYLRFPTRITEELEVKNLCPVIESVHLPRQKSARWCTVIFKTVEHKQEAMKILRKIEIDGKHIIVRSLKNKSKPVRSKKKSDCIDSVQELLNN